MSAPAPNQPPDPRAVYESPLATRNASPEMQLLWSPRRKFTSWRRLWIALAEAQHELGLNVTKEQIAELRAAVDLTEDDFARAAAHESKLRHDVMAHVHALGERAPGARAVIHLGATSQDVNCNTEIPILRDALDLVCAKTAKCVIALAEFAERWRDLPCLAFTHYQPAQPVTVGRRAAQWGYDLALCLERLERTRDSLRLRGMRGATGTQASYLALFDNDAEKVARLDALVAQKLAFPADKTYLVTGQTYPRVVDAFALADLAALAAVIHKICNDVRLLSNRKELDEPFGSTQIGSSAMPYKRNPMRCERATGLCRFVMNTAHNALDTAATQWLERTLDDSANRRLSLPESFLATDGALDLLHNVVSGLVVHEATVRANLMSELPFMASENLMMAAVRLGRDRQEVHEAIRRHAQEAGTRVKDEGLPNDLIDRLRSEPLLDGVDLDAAMDPSLYVGLSGTQVDRFRAEVSAPIAARYAGRLGPSREPSV
ncbi:MAG: adenylosuccinate lyase [Phycisphaerales bacterium]|nr:MAG: adenylosuccinate lyase [Phycisphaerales bacterium]